jgi:tRNA G10  N-methylase Trm11
MIEINRIWAMPNKLTFTIKPIKKLLQKYGYNKSWCDPFPYPFKVDALEYLKTLNSNSFDGCVFDPPYTRHQLKECYESKGMSLDQEKSQSFFRMVREELARIIKPGGLCISFGYTSCGLGKTRGFKILEILLVCHGADHYDTICTVDKKINHDVRSYIEVSK